VSPTVPLAQQVGRVPSTLIPLDAREQVRFERLIDSLLLIDKHQHTLVMPHDLHDGDAYAASYDFTWGYDAIRAGRWSAVGAACNMSALMHSVDGSHVAFEDLVDEVGLMLADIARQTGVVAVGCATDIERAHAVGSIGVLPVAEYLAIGDRPHRVDMLYGVGVRMGGLTCARRSQLGEGQAESSGAGLSELGREVLRRMNDVGMRGPGLLNSTTPDFVTAGEQDGELAVCGPS